MTTYAGIDNVMYAGPDKPNLFNYQSVIPGLAVRLCESSLSFAYSICVNVLFSNCRKVSRLFNTIWCTLYMYISSTEEENTEISCHITTTRNKKALNRTSYRVALFHSLEHNNQADLLIQSRRVYREYKGV